LLIDGAILEFFLVVRSRHSKRRIFFSVIIWLLAYPLDKLSAGE